MNLKQLLQKINSHDTPDAVQRFVKTLTMNDVLETALLHQLTGGETPADRLKALWALSPLDSPYPPHVLHAVSIAVDTETDHDVLFQMLGLLTVHAMHGDYDRMAYLTAFMGRDPANNALMVDVVLGVLASFVNELLQTDPCITRALMLLNNPEQYGAKFNFTFSNN